ncbi:sensor histidine kinase [Methanococcoides alaskense]|uniref:histidine kinase n=1 Tax=Methanococcoides alaskense TaxID=325778 RepID=A0AA90Z8W9_9EURY|nr:sensor histidine kinase [Methanococcoides alaskense]MDA0524375.1 sensor histidine kinase [Methanococcoides alaskense]MDR6223189.1 signal transduction histidine kinase [Methanococcoides alaskense]
MFATKSRWNVIIVVMITMLFISSILFLGIRANTEVEDLFVEMFTREQTSQAQQISTGITTFLNEKVTMLEIISRNHYNIPDDNFNTIFSIVYNESEGFHAIEYVNSTGIIVSGYPEENVPIGYDLYENDKAAAFEKIKDTDETYITNPLTTLEGELALYVWIPLYLDDGSFEGAIVAIIEMDEITKQTIKTEYESGYVYLIDDNAKLLYDSSDDHLVGNNYFNIINEPDHRRLDIIGMQTEGLSGSGQFSERNKNGFLEEKIISYVPVNWYNQQWSVGVVTPLWYVGSLIQSVYVKQGIFAMISIAFILFISAFIALILFSWNKTLEDEVKSKTSELERSNDYLQNANKKLKELDRLKNDFVSMVSHELKTPLTAMKTSSEFLRESECSREIKEEMLDLIIRNIDRQARMVDDLLDISRIESGKMKFIPEDVNIKEIIEIALHNVQKYANDKSIKIMVNCPEDVPVIRTDKDKLIRVFVNLLTNAIKFTPEEGEVSIIVEDHDNHLQTSIKDNGIGISREKRDKIFDKFYQVDSTATRKAGGTGLGLAIIKGIIDGQGGNIYLESETGKGSTFTFRLPKELKEDDFTEIEGA